MKHYRGIFSALKPKATTKLKPKSKKGGKK
jgi:hypothetical protein